MYTINNCIVWCICRAFATFDTESHSHTQSIWCSFICEFIFPIRMWMLILSVVRTVSQPTPCSSSLRNYIRTIHTHTHIGWKVPIHFFVHILPPKHDLNLSLPREKKPESLRIHLEYAFGIKVRNFSVSYDLNNRKIPCLPSYPFGNAFERNENQSVYKISYSPITDNKTFYSFV